MAKKVKEEHHVYKIVEVVGSSSTSWEDAARAAVEDVYKRQVYTTQCPYNPYCLLPNLSSALVEIKPIDSRRIAR